MRPRVALNVITMVLAVVARVADAQLANAPWPMFHHDPRHRGLSSAPGIVSPVLRWEFATPDSIVQSGPVIGPDAIYFGCVDHRVYALNLDGTVRWTFLTNNSVRLSTPAVAGDGTIYVGSMDSTFYALNHNGTLRWKVRGGSTFRSSPLLLDNGDVLVGNGDNNLYHWTSAGTLVWTFTTGGNVRSSPAVGPAGDVYVGSFDFSMYAITPAGTQRWRATTGNIIDLASPAVGADSIVYFGSTDQYVYALHPAGTLAWFYTAGASVEATPAIAADGTVIAAMGSRVVALDSLGHAKWTFFARNAIRSSPAVTSDGAIYFGSDDSTFYCLNANGSMRWSWPAGSAIRSPPAIGVDGTVLFGTFGGRLIALHDAVTAVDPPHRPAGLALASPWPVPARGAAHLRFTTPPGVVARLRIMDVTGRRVAALWEGAGDGSEQEVSWPLTDFSGRRVPPGVYRAVLIGGGSAMERRIIVEP